MIYIKLPWRHQTALSQSNINRKPLTHIYSYIQLCTGFNKFPRTTYIQPQHQPHAMPINCSIDIFQIHKRTKQTLLFAIYFSHFAYIYILITIYLRVNANSAYIVYCPYDQLSVGQMSVVQMSVVLMSVVLMSVIQMSAGQMSVFLMSVVIVSVGLMSVDLPSGHDIQLTRK